MKSFIFGFITLISFNVMANEMVRLKADMNYKRCITNEASADCRFEFPNPKEIKIVLEATDDQEMLFGKYTFTKQLDGITFFGTISVIKISVGSNSVYFLETYVESIFENDENTKRMQYMGSLQFDDISKIHRTTWVGGDVTYKRLTINPTITISASGY